GDGQGRQVWPDRGAPAAPPRRGPDRAAATAGRNATRSRYHVPGRSGLPANRGDVADDAGDPDPGGRGCAGTARPGDVAAGHTAECVAARRGGRPGRRFQRTTATAAAHRPARLRDGRADGTIGAHGGAAVWRRVWITVIVGKIPSRPLAAVAR